MYDIYITILEQFQKAIPMKLVDKVIIQSNVKSIPGLLIKFNPNTSVKRIEDLKKYLESKYRLKVTTQRVENYSSIRNEYLTMPRTEMYIFFKE